MTGTEGAQAFAVVFLGEHPDFSITVRSGFVSPWQWAVHAVVDYRGSALAARRYEIEAEAKIELLRAIAHESRRGRADGAKTVLVLVEGDREIAGLFDGLDERFTVVSSASPPRP